MKKYRPFCTRTHVLQGDISVELLDKNFARDDIDHTLVIAVVHIEDVRHCDDAMSIYRCSSHMMSTRLRLNAISGCILAS